MNFMCVEKTGQHRKDRIDSWPPSERAWRNKLESSPLEILTRYKDDTSTRNNRNSHIDYQLQQKDNGNVVISLPPGKIPAIDLPAFLNNIANTVMHEAMTTAVMNSLGKRNKIAIAEYKLKIRHGVLTDTARFHCQAKTMFTGNHVATVRGIISDDNGMEYAVAESVYLVFNIQKEQ